MRNEIGAIVALAGVIGGGPNARIDLTFLGADRRPWMEIDAFDDATAILIARGIGLGLTVAEIDSGDGPTVWLKGDMYIGDVEVTVTGPHHDHKRNGVKLRGCCAEVRTADELRALLGITREPTEIDPRRFRTDESEGAIFTLAEMTAGNAEDAQLIAQLCAMQPGDRIVTGGGAAGDGWVECLAVAS